jgi:hypothetical protein
MQKNKKAQDFSCAQIVPKLCPSKSKGSKNFLIDPKTQKILAVKSTH